MECKAAVLCNGPSRISYGPSALYDYVLGCNAPWTRVDATVVLDIQMVKAWDQHRDIIKCPVYYSRQSYEFAVQLDKDFYEPFTAGVLNIQSHAHSSGHNAVELLIKQGYKKIDVYGCDAYFNQSRSDSFTRSFIPIESPNAELRAHSKMVGWKARWDQLLADNPQCEIKFIR